MVQGLFQLGLMNYVEGRPRLLPCEAGMVNFFVDPYGDVYPCNGLENKYWKESMGNIRTMSSFDELWRSEQAERVRSRVRSCPKNCWMVGTAAPVMKKYLTTPAKWVLQHKFQSVWGNPVKLEDEER